MLAYFFISHIGKIFKYCRNSSVGVFMDSMKLSNSIKKDVFSRQDFVLAAKEIDPDFKETQLRFYLGKLQKEKLISRIGHNLYTKNVLEKKEYTAFYSITSKKIISILEKDFPLVSFRIWDLSCLNEFLNHLIAHNHIILEVEKDGMEFIYSRIREDFPKKVLLKPSQKEIEIYSTDDDIIIMPLKTESPEGASKVYNLSLEKLIVDMFSNKVLQSFISKGDYPQALEEMFSKYNINQAKLFRYARRRNKAELIHSFLKEKTDIKIYEVNK